MNKSFSAARLLYFIRKHGMENGKVYIISFFAMFGLLTLVFLLWTINGGPTYREELTYIIYLFGLFLSGAIFASRSFEMLGEKSKGIYWLGIPASHIEKIITIVFYSTVLFFISYNVCFFTVKWIAEWLIMNYDFYKVPVSYVKVDWNSTYGFGTAFPWFIYAFFSIQAFYILGSAYFSSYSFIKTTIAGAIIILLFIYYMNILSKTSVPVGYHLSGLEMTSFSEGEIHVYSLPKVFANIISWGIKLFCIPVFWVVIWFRLKEKEI